MMTAPYHGSRGNLSLLLVTASRVGLRTLPSFFSRMLKLSCRSFPSGGCLFSPERLFFYNNTPLRKHGRTLLISEMVIALSSLPLRPYFFFGVRHCLFLFLSAEDQGSFSEDENVALVSSPLFFPRKWAQMLFGFLFFLLPERPVRRNHVFS